MLLITNKVFNVAVNVLIIVAESDTITISSTMSKDMNDEAVSVVVYKKCKTLMMIVVNVIVVGALFTKVNVAMTVAELCA